MQMHVPATFTLSSKISITLPARSHAPTANLHLTLEDAYYLYNQIVKDQCDARENIKLRPNGQKPHPSRFERTRFRARVIAQEGGLHPPVCLPEEPNLAISS